MGDLSEEVLVVPSSVFTALGSFQGFTSEVDKYFPALLETSELTYLRRELVEQDPNFKQLIPYLILFSRDTAGNSTVFRYRRGVAGQESRLHFKRSLGIGGHVSRKDGEIPSAASYYAGLQRELFEEVSIQVPYRVKVVGLVNEDSTLVGKVHLGIVHLVELDSPEVCPLEVEMCEPEFASISTHMGDIESYENWSQLCLISGILSE